MINLSYFLLIVWFAVVLQINSLSQYDIGVRTDIKGRLLTPEEGCGYVKVGISRIVGGGRARDGGWPWMAALSGQCKTRRRHNCNFSGRHFICGGSLITTQHILTAAHCMYGIDLIFARIGSVNITTSKDGDYKDVRIVRQIPYSGYTPHLGINDIGIVYLGQDVTFTNRISPICLPDELIQNRSLAGYTPFVAGWGRTHENGSMSEILQNTQVPIISNEECKEMYFNLHDERYSEASQFSDRVLCAGFTEGGQDSCNGDSGSPLMFSDNRNRTFRYFQIGIVSSGHACARANIPGIYTNVRKYVDWIKHYVNRSETISEL